MLGDRYPLFLFLITSGIPPAGVHIGIIPVESASNRDMGRPSYNDDRMKKSPLRR